MKSILDPSFRYRSSINTDLKKNFAKVRREKREKHQRNPLDTTGNFNVLRMPSRTP